MIDLDDLVDDLNESAAQTYDTLCQATIDVLHRAVEAIGQLRVTRSGAESAASRTEAFLEFWDQDEQKNHIIYGLGRQDEMRELTTQDLRTMVAAVRKSPDIRPEKS